MMASNSDLKFNHINNNKVDKLMYYLSLKLESKFVVQNKAQNSLSILKPNQVQY